jgi:hypothetical protein
LKRGKKKGATSYTEGDLVAILNSIQEILPLTDLQWERVAFHFNAHYATRFRRAERTAKVLKSKFRELSFGAPSGGGTRNEFEKRAKDIKKLIDQSTGVKRSDNATATTTTSISGLSPSFRKRTQMKFEKEIMDYLTKTEKNEEERQKAEAKKHEERMLMFEKLIEKL